MTATNYVHLHELKTGTFFKRVSENKVLPTLYYLNSLPNVATENLSTINHNIIVIPFTSNYAPVELRQSSLVTEWLPSTEEKVLVAPFLD